MMLVRRGDRRMTHPKLRRFPSFPVARRQGGPEQRPLQAVWRPVRAGHVGGQIPPFDPVGGVGAMVGRKLQRGAGDRQCEILGF